ncbi:MAG: hypothetical protein QGH40_05120 [bacterium]|nr:hypothetical protein [bacterium]
MRVISTEVTDDRVMLIVQASGRRLKFSISLDDARRLHAIKIDANHFDTLYTSEKEQSE